MKVGLLGAGSIGLRHARNLRDLGHEIIGYDPDPAAQVGAAAVSAWYPDRLHMINEADAVVIASPTVSHYEDLLSCMAADKPTFVEKPIAANEDEWKSLRDCEAISRVFVGYNLRFHPCVALAKDCLDEGAIGEPLWGSFVCAQLSEKEAYRRDGVILNWSHEIDLARHMFGHAVVFGAVVRVPDGRDDMADIFMGHRNGRVRSAVHLNYLTEPRAREFVIVGTKGSISADLIGGVVSIKDAPNPDHLVTYFDSGPWDKCYVDEMRAFLSHIEGKSTLGATGEDGLDVLRNCLDVRKLGGLS